MRVGKIKSSVLISLAVIVGSVMMINNYSPAEAQIYFSEKVPEGSRTTGAQKFYGQAQPLEAGPETSLLSIFLAVVVGSVAAALILVFGLRHTPAGQPLNNGVRP